MCIAQQWAIRNNRGSNRVRTRNRTRRCTTNVEAVNATVKKVEAGDAPAFLIIKSPEAEHVCKMDLKPIKVKATKILVDPVKRYVISHNLNWQVTQSNPEIPKGMSMTVPDKSLTIRQIIENALRGQQPQQLGMLPVFNEDIYVPDVRKMDITDIDMYKRGYQLEKLKVERQIEDLKYTDDGQDRIKAIDEVLTELVEARKQKAVKPTEN